MKFKIPSNVRLCGMDHPVNLSSDSLSSHNNRGLANYCTRTITVAENMAPDQVRRTFLHEAIHQIDDLMGIKLTERQANCLATGVSELIGQLEVDDAGQE